MGGRSVAFVLSVLVGALVSGSASAQAPPLQGPPLAIPPLATPPVQPLPNDTAPTVSDSQRRAAIAELQKAKGIGGCILLEMDTASRTASLTHFGLGQPGMPPGFLPAVAQVAQRCSGRPYSSSDLAVTNAAIAAFKRGAVAVYFATELGIGQRRLDDVWRRAPGPEKAPFIDAAKSAMDPAIPGRAPTLEEARLLALRLGITSQDPGRLAPVHQYYFATALAELAEAQLEKEGAQPQ